MEHTSGCQRLCQSIFCAIVGFPLVLIGASVLLGWNEKRDVCEQKAILAGDSNYKGVTCTDSSEHEGELVFFNCNLLQDGLAAQGFSGFGGGVFASTLSGYVGTGIKVEAEMLQCTERSESRKDNVGGGTTTYYNYDRAWRSSWIDPYRFHDRDKARDQCAGLQPSWPPEVPPTGSYYVNTVMADVWTLPTSLVRKIPLDTSITGTAPAGWQRSEGSLFTFGTGNSIGDIRIRFKGNNWNNVAVSVLGKNLMGTIQDWVAPDDWLCSGYTLQDLRMGTIEISKMWEMQRAESSGMTWALRFLGFALAWIAFCLLAGPLEVATDCIPCIGPMLGNAVSAIACCVSCLPATACTMGVVGVVWIVMRPMVGIPLIIIFLLVMIGMIVWKCCFAKKGKKVYDSEGGGGDDPGTVVGKQDKQHYSGAVGVLFDANGNAEGALGPFEEEVRAAGDKEACINSIAERWHLVM